MIFSLFPTIIESPSVFTADDKLKALAMILQRESEHEKSPIGCQMDPSISRAGREALKILFPKGME